MPNHPIAALSVDTLTNVTGGWTSPWSTSGATTPASTGSTWSTSGAATPASNGGTGGSTGWPALPQLPAPTPTPSPTWPNQNWWGRSWG